MAKRYTYDELMESKMAQLRANDPYYSSLPLSSGTQHPDAVTVLMLGIASIFLNIVALAGLFLGVRALRQIKESNGAMRADGTLWAGIIMSIIGMIELIVAVIFILIAVSMFAGN